MVTAGETSVVAVGPATGPTPPSIASAPLAAVDHDSTLAEPVTTVVGAARKLTKAGSASMLPLAFPATALKAATVAVAPVQFW